MTESKDFCSLCGNPQRDKAHDSCKDMMCYWFSHWQVDNTDSESVKNEAYIKGEIRDMNW